MSSSDSVASAPAQEPKLTRAKLVTTMRRLNQRKDQESDSTPMRALDFFMLADLARELGLAAGDTELVAFLESFGDEVWIGDSQESVIIFGSLMHDVIPPVES